jgi:hypothetical protein
VVIRKRYPLMEHSKTRHSVHRTTTTLLICYVVVCLAAVAAVGLTPGNAPMAEMAYGLSLLFTFAFIFVLAVVLFGVFYVLGASKRKYWCLAGTLACWGMFVIYGFADEIPAMFIPRGHYYAISYRNESKQDIFVDGVGDLRISKDSGTRTVYKTPSKIVWWNGSTWRTPTKSDKMQKVESPPELQFGDSLISTFTREGEWETTIE